jgi:alpha,alpha-trehalose phosphorylase
LTWTINSDTLLIKQLLNEESLYFTGNGYIGVRGSFEEGYAEGEKSIRGTYLNAFHDVSDIPYGEKLFAFPETEQKLLNVIDSQTISIYVGEGQEEERFSLFEGEVLSYQRALHLDQGFTERVIHWRSPLGKEVKLSFKRLVPFKEKEIFIQQVIVEPVTYYGLVRMVSSVDGDVSNYVDPADPRVASGHGKRLNVSTVQQKGELSLVECETERLGLACACGSVYKLSPSGKRKDSVRGLSIESEFIVELREKVVLEKKNAYVDTLRHGDNLVEKLSSIHEQLEEQDFDTLLQQQIEYLTTFWKNTNVEIRGDASLQEGIRFNLFHLLQSTGRDRYSNIAAKGLSGEGYEGHYFWDTEIYMFPVFLMTNPELAKQLLLYRYSILDHARARAKEMGHKQGALFPWRTISGSESSSFFPAGTAQYHISADIAYSYIQYDMVTNDHQFLLDHGAEVLFETARLWLDVGHFQDGLFKIDAVTGPDEYTCIVNNNYYTNTMAKHNLKWAVKVYDRLKSSAEEALTSLSRRINLREEEVEQWVKAAESMYLPYDQGRQMNPQDDTFLQKAVWDIENTPKDHFPLLLHYHPLTLYRYQVCKQADTVLAHFLLEDEQDFNVIKNSYDYYEKITTHDSSLSSCIFSIMASKIGYHEKAYDYFIETVRMDLDNTHGNTKDGLHMANMGGTWLSIVFGFAQLRVKEDGVSFSPHLPKNWEGYSFAFQYKGCQLQLNVSKQDVVIHLLNGEPLTIRIYGQDYPATRDESVKVALK